MARSSRASPTGAAGCRTGGGARFRRLGGNDGAARDQDRLELVAPVEPKREACGSGRQVAGERLVEHPEQGALELHRQPAVGAERLELDGHAGAPAAIARRAAHRRHEAEVVEDHRPHVEDERLRGVERLLHHPDELADLVRSTLGIASHKALDDLGLEHDVGQALRRPVVHLSRCHRLLNMLETNSLNEADIAQMEERDAVFPDVDARALGA